MTGYDGKLGGNTAMSFKTAINKCQESTVKYGKELKIFWK